MIKSPEDGADKHDGLHQVATPEPAGFGGQAKHPFQAEAPQPPRSRGALAAEEPDDAPYRDDDGVWEGGEMVIEPPFLEGHTESNEQNIRL
jgi:hypothetical protein